MRTKAALIVTFLIAASHANAEKIELSNMRCRQYLATDQDTSNTILAWLVGFYSEAGDPPVIDLGKLRQAREKFSVFCTANPDFGVATAAEGILGN